jgi:hypothetical protein
MIAKPLNEVKMADLESTSWKRPRGKTVEFKREMPARTSVIYCAGSGQPIPAEDAGERATDTGYVEGCAGLMIK